MLVVCCRCARLGDTCTRRRHHTSRAQVVREASKRVLGLRPFDVQCIGGMILHEGQIAEMRTGEVRSTPHTCGRHATRGRAPHARSTSAQLQPPAAAVSGARSRARDRRRARSASSSAGQDARGGAARLPQRPDGQGRARGDGQRLPGAPRQRVGGPGAPLPRPQGAAAGCCGPGSRGAWRSRRTPS